MKQRFSILVALLLVLSMVLSACGGGAEPTPAADTAAPAGDAAAAPAEEAPRPPAAKP